ncbi:hypothetical protein MBT84_22310 [Streptomyces sp. MBT84]|nr:hypothetical protein [Streptomyces sp. MBT84]
MTLQCDWCSKDSVFLRLVEITMVTGQGPIRERFDTLDVEQVWPNQTPRK